VALKIAGPLFRHRADSQIGSVGGSWEPRLPRTDNFLRTISLS
jgi:hypothetical protein